MTDTNQLREAFEVRMTDGGKWPAAVESGRGGAYRLAQTENAWTEWQACAESLQAIAQATQPAEADEGKVDGSMWLSGEGDAQMPRGIMAYTTPQPAQATQPAQVTGLLEAFDDAVSQELPRVSHVEYDSHEICKQFASKIRAILALRPVQVPMTDEQVDELCGEANRGYFIGREEYFKAFRDAEHAHGITAQAKKETP